MQSYGDRVNVSENINTYCIVLAANRKVTDLETKIQEIEREKKEQNHGELLITIILCSMPLQSYTDIVNVSKNKKIPIVIVLAANMIVTDLETKLQRMAEEKIEQNRGK